MDNSAPTTNATTQQFCLRWHNHQTSLLSSLPLLLDQSLLTDVTLSAEGRTVRAHRVVLSACSSFFQDLFRTLEPPFHPVIVLPGASFGAMVALLTFMYSGEVNVFEEQISGLLSLAETLGIKGLADFNGNSSNSPPKSETPVPKEPDTPSPSPTPTNIAKVVSPLETLFAKTFQFCPSMMANPLNFSPSAISRGAEIFARYQNQCRINQMDKSADALDENSNKKCLNLMDNKRPIKNAGESLRKIDKIAENLRIGTTAAAAKNCTGDPVKLPLVLASHSPPASLMLKPQSFSSLAQFMAENIVENNNNNNNSNTNNNMPKPECLQMDREHHHQQQLQQQHHHHHHIQMQHLQQQQQQQQQLHQQHQQQQQHQSQPPAPTFHPGDPMVTDAMAEKTNLPKPSNSKLYATCFICHKQLSNQYNLRVHLETHQNVRYACNVCSHVSRSKDALRKHVSYRHPGAPSPCESEAKRKRTKAAAAAAIKQELSNLPSTSQQYAQMSLQQQLQSSLFPVEPQLYQPAQSPSFPQSAIDLHQFKSDPSSSGGVVAAQSTTKNSAAVAAVTTSTTSPTSTASVASTAANDTLHRSIVDAVVQ